MNRYDRVKKQLRDWPRKWAITGVAGFIGSHLLESLLKLNQNVVGIDNFSTGRKTNLDDVRASVSSEQWSRFHFIEGDIRNLDACRHVCAQVDFVMHQAALGSVPRSVSDPVATNDANVTGTLNILVAARDAEVKRLVYASSSSVYGDHEALPKTENITGNALSPYAVSKVIAELYAKVFTSCYQFESIGLRYFNVFGPRQDPNGAYAAVIPKWINSMMSYEDVVVFGDGETTRDFCFVDNAVQANILAALVSLEDQTDCVFNIAVGERATLNDLFCAIQALLRSRGPEFRAGGPTYASFRVGDIRHSIADISRARDLLGYQPQYRLEEGLEVTVDWYLKKRGGLAKEGA